MIAIERWMDLLTDKLTDCFGERLLIVGLQGSYKREEANEDSDIDVIVILDTLSINDLGLYKKILATMPEHEKSCGFINSRQEMIVWPKHELFQFAHDTRTFYGSLEGLLPQTICAMANMLQPKLDCVRCFPPRNKRFLLLELIGALTKPCQEYSHWFIVFPLFATVGTVLH